MPSTSRPRGFSGGSNTSGSGRPVPTNTPMSERQQMALLMQMTSSSQQPELSPGGHASARGRDKNGRGESPLHVAAIKGDHDAVKKLLDQGMSPNLADNAGWTPLHEACNHGHYNVASLLIKAGANVNAKGYEDVTPLHDAALDGQLKLVKLLVERGADPTSKNHKGKTPVDIAAPSVYGYLKDAAASRTAASVASTTSSASGVQMKKPAAQEAKKVPAEDATLSEDASSQASSTPGRSTPSQKVEEDVYEFKTTPKDSTSGGNSSDDGTSGKIEAGVEKAAPEEKASSEDASVSTPGSSSVTVSVTTASGGSQAAGSVQQKRPYQEIETSDEVVDDEMKRKKRKDSETLTKEPAPGKVGTPTRMPQASKTAKPVGNAQKAAGAAATAKPSSTIERKSPCASPKPQAPPTGASGATGQTTTTLSGSTPTPLAGTQAGSVGKQSESDSETGDEASAKNPSGLGAESGGFPASGPKVPPLKIVIPQQSSSADPEASLRNGKSVSARNHPALPYVVASSNSNEASADKESSSSRCASPTEVAGAAGKTATGEEKKPVLTVAVATTGGSSAASSGASGQGTDDRAQPRVLRSSHRSGGTSGGSGGPTTDRGSNNSSPQMQNSSSPSPAPPTSASGVMEGGGGSATNGSSGTTGSNAGTNANAATGGIANGGTSSPTNATASVSGSASETDGGGNAPSPSSATSSTSSSTVQSQNTVELHPRKRKIRASKEDSKTVTNSSAAGVVSGSGGATEQQESVSSTEVHPHDQPITNCYQMFLNIRKQIERRQKNLFLVQPKPPQGFKDYLMNRCTYVLAGKTNTEPTINYPVNIPSAMKEQFAGQEKERHRLKMQHVVEKEKLVLAVEQEILRVHGRAARALANQSLPFSVCTILKDEEVYNMLTPEQEEKDRNARSRYNGRLFLSWLQDVDDKWEKIKEAMLLRHHNEAESLHAVQKMDWEFKMKELSLCEFKAKPVIEDLHVPMVHVSDDFDLLPP
ncbi:ankyrin repeat domain-containing protein 11 isoform X1 [Phlebotomus argentipes]|uniref:ankyrin repeat domain-containing protein 11 isoform X1 n=1 Tax=Phlebotomus argentipes TaxID=94469 RepID=UPI0028937A09|nr:ankyrin repeat domain-containing protein 11 isoform X1 [Phlebotomus argentipes]